MPSRHHTAVAAVFFVTLAAPSIVAAQGDLSAPVLIATPAATTPLIRIDSNVRGRADRLPEVITMTSGRYNARTVTDRPTLYWFLSRKTEGSVKFALREHGSRRARPVFECEVRGPLAPGIRHIKLADHRVSLNSKTTYAWFVRLEQPGAQDAPSSTSFIEVGDLTGLAPLRQELSAATPAERYKRVAAEFWYDALDTIVTMVAATPLSRDYRGRYGELLRHGALDDVAAFVAAAPPHQGTTLTEKCTPLS